MVNDCSNKQVFQLEVDRCKLSTELRKSIDKHCNLLFQHQYQPSMFHFSRKLFERASKWQLSTTAGLTGNQVQSTLQNSSTIRNCNQYNRSEYHNTCHKRLSSGNAPSQSSSVSNMKRLAGKVAVVTASTDG